MIWTGKLPLATAQQFNGHALQSLDPESNILFCLKEDCSNKNISANLTYSERAFVFPNKTMLYLSL